MLANTVTYTDIGNLNNYKETLKSRLQRDVAAFFIYTSHYINILIGLIAIISSGYGTVLTPRQTIYMPLYEAEANSQQALPVRKTPAALR